MRKHLPKSVYVRIQNDGDESYFLCAEKMNELGIDVGEKAKIGVYKLIGTHDAEGVIETSRMWKDEI